MISIDLAGKTALVTGASQGLGAAIARTLHQAGANLAINFWNNPDGTNRAKAQGLAAELGERAAAWGADVRMPEEIAAMTDAACRRFGGLDILVNNAGILRDRTLKNMTQRQWQEVIDTNLTGVFNVCKQAERLRDGGRIVNISSLSAAMGVFGQANYAAAKAGVIGLTKVLSRELAKRNITVNAVAPGVVLTEMGLSIPEGARAEMLRTIPLGRFGRPEDVARCVLFLVSDLAEYITGQTLHVNGGCWG